VITSTTAAAPDDTKTPSRGLAERSATIKTFLIVNQDWAKILPSISIIKPHFPAPLYWLKGQFDPILETSLTTDKVHFKSTSRPTGWMLHH
jgi:hypothetical protein